jgi:hypothetical protein
MIERAKVVIVGWSGVGDVKIEHRHYARVNTVDIVKRYVVGIRDTRVDCLQLLHTIEAG